MNGRAALSLSMLLLISAPPLQAETSRGKHPADMYRLVGCLDGEHECQSTCLPKTEYFIITSPESCTDLFQRGSVLCFCLIKEREGQAAAKL